MIYVFKKKSFITKLMKTTSFSHFGASNRYPLHQPTEAVIHFITKAGNIFTFHYSCTFHFRCEVHLHISLYRQVIVLHFITKAGHICAGAVTHFIARARLLSSLQGQSTVTYFITRSKYSLFLHGQCTVAHVFTWAVHSCSFPYSGRIHLIMCLHGQHTVAHFFTAMIGQSCSCVYMGSIQLLISLQQQDKLLMSLHEQYTVAHFHTMAA